MRKNRCFLLILACVFAVTTTNAQAPIAIGTAYPKASLKMKAVSGNLVSLEDAKGSNGLLVIFISNTCPYNVKSQQRLNALDAFARQNGVGVIFLNSNENLRNSDESLASMDAYAKRSNITGEYAMDSNSELADALGASRTPECFLFDGAGKLAYHGATEENPADPSNGGAAFGRKAITELAAGSKISVNDTRVLGCAIKRKK